jgi:hypothetical protein
MLKVCETIDGKFAVFMPGWLNQLTQMDDKVFDTEHEATAHMQEQMDSADFSDLEDEEFK